MTSDKPFSDTDVFVKAANGEVAGSYLTDGRWNIGGWSTYPTTNELATDSKRPPSPPNQGTIRR